MKFVKKGWLDLKTILASRSRRVIFCICFLFLSLVLYLVIPIFLLSRSELALIALAKSYRQEKICHEECYVWRQTQEKLIVNDWEMTLKKGKNKFAKKIIAYWLDPKEDSEFKKELVRMAALTYGTDNPPDYFLEYLNNPRAEAVLIREITLQFNLGETRSQNLRVNLLNEIKNATSSQEKVSALKTLGALNNDGEIDNYFFILNSAESFEVKSEAIKNISSIRNKTAAFSLAQLSAIKGLVLNPETNSRLRQELTLLLGDYYLVFPAESEKVWRAVVANIELDSISRTFSADSLNHLTGANLTLPPVSSSEWADYYNQ